MPIDKVVLEDEVKLFRANPLILFTLCSPHYDWTGAKMDWPKPVPVVDEDGFVIGSADVYADANYIRAKIVIDYQCPERFDIQTGREIYPHPSCVIDLDESGALDPWKPCKVKNLQLQRIRLSHVHPACIYSDPLTEAKEGV